MTFRLQRIAISPAQITDKQINLASEQYHYLVRVLRLNDGDKFIAIDGIGHWWLANLQGENGHIIEELQVETEIAATIVLLTALPKGNGFDEVVRVCTELGVAAFIPLLSDRTLLKPSTQKLERWQRIAQEAAEQSERTYIPTIYEPMDFPKGLALFNTNYRFICEGRGDYPHLYSQLPTLSNTKQPTIAIATGPEGGWSTAEIQQAVSMGFQPVSLGKRIFRAISAPMVATSILTAYLEANSPIN